MGLDVIIQEPPCYILPSVWALDLFPLPLLIALPLSRHPTFVGLVCPDPEGPACLADHAHSFLKVFLQSHLVKDPRQRVEQGLDPPRVGGGCHLVVRI